ncbi:hypothetical protein BJ508DRAFT_359323 [Ascobolus immersus RN42]|uniref:Uncharacterized protein n=1 Tax=Ascobolus immersus RN42 TaxID=1160509 RepID=A0A3N4IFM2_ASCIM|nr:hypothetical protein BJ508DRAFT_359323 [Ascobolus immersus RN42]
MCLKFSETHSFTPDPTARSLDPEVAARLRYVRGTRAIADELNLTPQARDAASRSLAYTSAPTGMSFTDLFRKLEHPSRSGVPKSYVERENVYDPGAPGTRVLFGDYAKQVRKMTVEEREEWFERREEMRRVGERERVERMNSDMEARLRGEKRKGVTVGRERRVWDAVAGVVVDALRWG